MTTYSMEAWMGMSWFTRNAADHARGIAPTRCFTPGPPEGVREFVMKLSVVQIRLSIRSMNLDFSERLRDRWLILLQIVT